MFGKKNPKHKLPKMCPGQILPRQDSEIAVVTKIFQRRDVSFQPLFSVGRNKTLKTHTHSVDDGDCEGAIATAAAAVTNNVPSLSQEVGSGDEGLCLIN